MNSILNFLQAKFPILFIIVIVSIIIWYIAKFYFVRFKKTEEKINNAPCYKCEDFYNNVSELKENVRDIKEYIFKKDPKSAIGMFVKFSPLKLTEKGQLLLEKSGGQQCIDKNVDYFIDEISKLNPMVALDVENNALSVLHSNANKEFFNEIKNFVYNAPCPYIIKDNNGQKVEFTEMIDIYIIIRVMSIYLRDKFLVKYPEYESVK